MSWKRDEFNNPNSGSNFETLAKMIFVVDYCDLYFCDGSTTWTVASIWLFSLSHHSVSQLLPFWANVTSDLHGSKLELCVIKSQTSNLSHFSYFRGNIKKRSDSPQNWIKVSWNSPKESTQVTTASCTRRSLTWRWQEALAGGSAAEKLMREIGLHRECRSMCTM